MFQKFQSDFNGKLVQKKNKRIISGPGSILGVWRKEGSKYSVYTTPNQVAVPFMFMIYKKYNGPVANCADVWFLIASVVYCNSPIITKL